MSHIACYVYAKANPSDSIDESRRIFFECINQTSLWGVITDLLHDICGKEDGMTPEYLLSNNDIHCLLIVNGEEQRPEYVVYKEDVRQHDGIIACFYKRYPHSYLSPDIDGEVLALMEV